MEKRIEDFVKIAIAVKCNRGDNRTRYILSKNELLLSGVMAIMYYQGGLYSICVAKFLNGPFHSILSFKNIGTSIEKRFDYNHLE
jgi:hypothetical protein